VISPAQPERVDAYEGFFGLSEPPFSLAPDPRFLFASASHSAALAQVAYALERREPLVVITGEIGTGKTLLCRTVLQRLPFKTFLSVIEDPLLECDDLLKQLLQDFGVISKDRTKLAETSRHELVQALRAFLTSLARIQAHAVVMIDEAQHLKPDVLEEIRLLSNIDDTRGTVLQIILVGQTDLESLLSRPDLRQLQQRVSRRLRLEVLNRAEAEQYIQHRLAVARNGAGTTQGVEFTPDAIDAVSQLSGGVPRVINLLCDRSLEGAFASRVRVIDSRLIHPAARALGVEPAGEIARAVDEAGPGDGADADARPTAVPRVTKYLVLAGSVALVGVVALFGVRSVRPPAAARVPAGANTVTQKPAPAAGTPAPAVGTPAPAAGTPAPPQAAAPNPSTVAAAATGGGFDIVVASFRTDARAASVAAEVAALGLPIRRRVVDGWQQVISGPFASRGDAEVAHQRLDHAGLTGTQIVPTAR
jgi:general secretion pathway protein A